MKIARVLFVIMCLILRGGIASAQQPQPPAVEKQLVQFSGVVVTEEGGRMVPVPYAGIVVPKRKVGTAANYQGFFSIVKHVE